MATLNDLAATITELRTGFAKAFTRLQEEHGRERVAKALASSRQAELRQVLTADAAARRRYDAQCDAEEEPGDDDTALAEMTPAVMRGRGGMKVALMTALLAVALNISKRLAIALGRALPRDLDANGVDRNTRARLKT
jgi:hypothetical protein